MATIPKGKAEVDALIAAQKLQAAQGTHATPIPKGRAEVDVFLASQKKINPEVRHNFIQTLAKPFIKTAGAIPAFVGGVSNLLDGDVAGARESLTRERSFGPLGVARPIGIKETGERYKGVKGGLGFLKDVAATGAELGSYLAPLSGVTKGVQTALKTGVRASLPTVIKDQAITGAVSGLFGGAGQEAQKQKSTFKSIAGAGGRGVVLGSITGVALPTTSAIARGTMRGVANIGAEVIGRSTGAGEGAIREAFNNPNVLKFARGATGSVEDLMTTALNDARYGLSKLRKNRGEEYVSELNKIKLNKSQLDGLIIGARTKARDLISDLDIKFTEGKLLNTLDFSNSTIERAQGTVQKAFNDVMRWTNVTPAGLDKLKKKLDQHLDEIPVTERGGAFNFILQLKDSISDGLKQSVPGYEKMTSKYSEASELITEIQRALSLKDTVAKDTAIRKLMSSMRQGNELRKELLKTIGTVSGKDITGKIAGATLAAKTPRGLAGVLQPGIAGAGLLSVAINPSTLPGLLLYLGTSSPRLMAEAVTLLGKFKGTEIPQVIKKQLRNLIIRALNEGSSNNSSLQND